jgi:signal transduction histidine kinase
VDTRSASAHVVLNTVDGCVALLVAYLLHGRFTRDRSVHYLLLAQGFVLLAVAGLGLGPGLRAVVGSPVGTVDVWLPLALRVLGAAIIAAAAVVRPRPVGRTWWQSSPLPLPAAAVALVWALLWALGRRVPVAVPDVHSDSGVPDLLSGHPLLLAGQALSAVFLLTASVLFTVRSLRIKDELFVWLGPACALAGFSRVHYMLFPSLYTDRLYAGDVLRTACYVVLLVGAVRELNQYWAAQARAAVLDDRRRLARELHDGVAQELAFIRAESYAIPESMPTRARIMAACDRALDEARAGIHALGRPGTEPLGFMLHRAAREMAERYDIELEVDVDDSITARAEQKHALLRIVSEAVSNAVRHGEARRLWLSLARDGDRRRLTISDDGCGFDAGRANSGTGGYGLTSMRDRARALPGSFDLSTGLGAGTQVTVTW